MTSRPPAPRNLDDILAGAEHPHAVEASTADEIPARKATGLPWKSLGSGATAIVRFLLRMQARRHAMLQWLAANTPRKSMNDLLCDLLEPALDAVIKARLKHLD